MKSFCGKEQKHPRRTSRSPFRSIRMRRRKQNRQRIFSFPRTTFFSLDAFSTDWTYTRSTIHRPWTSHCSHDEEEKERETNKRRDLYNKMPIVTRERKQIECRFKRHMNNVFSSNIFRFEKTTERKNHETLMESAHLSTSRCCSVVLHRLDVSR